MHTANPAQSKYTLIHSGKNHTRLKYCNFYTDFVHKGRETQQQQQQQQQQQNDDIDKGNKHNNRINKNNNNNNHHKNIKT